MDFLEKKISMEKIMMEILTGLSKEKKHSSLYTLSWGPGIRDDPAKPSKAVIISILF